MSLVPIDLQLKSMGFNSELGLHEAFQKQLNNSDAEKVGMICLVRNGQRLISAMKGLFSDSDAILA